MKCSKETRTKGKRNRFRGRWVQKTFRPSKKRKKTRKSGKSRLTKPIIEGNRKFYIQSAFAMPDEEKRATELKPFSLTGDSFPKIVVRQDIDKPWYDEQGVLNIGLVDFLLDRSVME